MTLPAPELTRKIKSYLNAQRILDESGFIKQIGSDEDGIVTFLIFGFRYPKESKAQNNFKVMMEAMLNFVIDR